MNAETLEKLKTLRERISHRLDHLTSDKALITAKKDALQVAKTSLNSIISGEITGDEAIAALVTINELVGV